MKSYRTWAIFLAAMLVAAGCSTANKKPNQESAIQGNIPASSPFSKVQVGMSQKQVHDILGQPTDTSNHTTGKMFIPFYFGNDMMRFEEYYKGMGRLTFTGVGVGGVNLKLYSGVYDPSEDGYPGN